MAFALTPQRPRPSVFATFLALSLLLHLTVLAWLNRAKLSLGEAEPPPIVVKLAPPPPPAPAQRAAPAARPAPPAKAPAPPRDAARVQNQIVAPSDQENEQPPLGRAYLSDRDNRVDKESVKRGNPEAGTSSETPPAERVATAPKPPPAPPAAPARPAAPRAAPPPRPAAKADTRSARAAPPPSRGEIDVPGETMPAGKPLPGLDRLLAPPAEVLARNEAAAREPDDGAPSGRADERSAAVDPRRDLMSAPPPVRGIFSGPRGTFDDLPDVAQGNLTLLNTKADRFAPFVRRVGTRVFQNLLIYQRRDLGLKDVLAAHDAITVRATLDRNGKLKDIDVEERSGSLAVDQTLLNALRQAAFDQNPPASAANDKGEFEFVFQAQLAAAIGPGAGEPQIQAIESRLRVGLL